MAFQRGTLFSCRNNGQLLAISSFQFAARILIEVVIDAADIESEGKALFRISPALL